MLFTLKIRLRSAILSADAEGEMSDVDDCRFERDVSGRPMLPTSMWFSRFEQVFEQLKIKRDASIIRMDPSVPAETYVHKRNYNKNQWRKHEAIKSGTELSLSGMTMVDPSTKAEPFTIDELRTIFEKIGVYIGISPWGRKWGYGEFDVTWIQPADK